MANHERVKPYGVRALELTYGMEIPNSRVVDYEGPRLETLMSPTLDRGTVPTNPCGCNGSRAMAILTGNKANAVVYSRGYSWDEDDELCYRFVVEGDVPKLLDRLADAYELGDAKLVKELRVQLAGEKFIAKAPKKSLRLGARKKHKVKKPGSCPARGNRSTARISTVHALEDVEAARKRARKKKT